MPNPDWGVKRTCPSCATRFYDLMREPVTCPECDTVIDLSKPAKGSPLTVATAAAKAKAKVAEAAKPPVDDEDSSDDDLLVDDDDDDAADVDKDADADDTASGGPALSDENSDDEPVEFADAVLLDEDEDDDDDLDSIDVKPRKDEEG